MRLAGEAETAVRELADLQRGACSSAPTTAPSQPAAAHRRLPRALPGVHVDVRRVLARRIGAEWRPAASISASSRSAGRARPRHRGRRLGRSHAPGAGGASVREARAVHMDEVAGSPSWRTTTRPGRATVCFCCTNGATIRSTSGSRCRASTPSSARSAWASGRDPASPVRGRRAGAPNWWRSTCRNSTQAPAAPGLPQDRRPLARRARVPARGPGAGDRPVGGRQARAVGTRRCTAGGRRRPHGCEIRREERRGIQVPARRALRAAAGMAHAVSMPPLVTTIPRGRSRRWPRVSLDEAITPARLGRTLTHGTPRRWRC